jgi:hypothetical protein
MGQPPRFPPGFLPRSVKSEASNALDWSEHTYAKEGELILEALGGASDFLAGHLKTRIQNWKTEQGGAKAV